MAKTAQQLLAEAESLFAAGQLVEARTRLKALIRKDASIRRAHFGLALIGLQLGDFEAGLQAINKAIRLNADDVDSYQLQGELLGKLGRLEEALDSYLAARELDATSFVTLMNLGDLQTKLGQHEQACEAFRAALETNSRDAKAMENLAFALMRSRDFGAAVEWFHQTAEAYSARRPLPQPTDTVPRSQLKHDHEQLEYLRERDLLDARYRDCAEALADIVRGTEDARAESGNAGVSLTGEQSGALAPLFRGVVYRDDGDRVDGPAINPALDTDAITAEYHARFPQIVVIDDILSEDALGGLYRFCLESTVFKRAYGSGYVGAILAEGFASPLLMQVADELRQALPEVIGDQPINQAWAYKYDSQLSGIKVHADFAAVNCNLWISPDEGNLDADSGGLILWDKECPRDWSFEDYNRNEAKIMSYLHDNDAQSIRVPYRQNRAVLFNSTLFHRTDDIHFRDRYDQRRINITLLYGTGMKYSR